MILQEATEFHTRGLEGFRLLPTNSLWGKGQSRKEKSSKLKENNGTRTCG